MNLIQKQHAARFQIGQNRHQIAGPLNRRAGRRPQRRAHFIGDNQRQARLAQTRRPVQQDMVQRLAAPLRRRQKDAQAFLDFRLPDKLAQPLGPQRVFIAVIVCRLSGEIIRSVIRTVYQFVLDKFARVILPPPV